jgi:uncharacterized protein
MLTDGTAVKNHTMVYHYYYLYSTLRKSSHTPGFAFFNLNIHHMETSIATRSNLQIIQQAFNDFAKGNIPAIIDTLAEDVRWGSFKIPGAAMSGNFFGKEGVQEFFKHLDEQIRFSVFEPREFIVQGDSIIVLGHQAGIVKSTGKSFDHDWCFSFKMKESKVQSYFAFTDSYEQAKAFS